MRGCNFIVKGAGLMVVRCDRGTLHSHCGVSSCQELAEVACGFVVHPRGKQPQPCGMKLCDGHAMPFKGALHCPPHFKLVGRVGRS